MDPFTMVFLIVLIVFASRLGVLYIRERGARGNDAVDEALVGELDALKQRVAVLEEIVTDGKFQLSREFDRLEQTAPPRGAGPDSP